MSDQLRNKLSQIQVEPPEKVWDEVSAALDHSQFSFPQKLYQYQEQPPNDIWASISTHLDNEKEAKEVVPFIQRSSKALRYVSAAAILLIVASLIIFFITRSNDTDTIASEDRTNQAPATTTVITQQNSDDSIDLINEEDDRSGSDNTSTAKVNSQKNGVATSPRINSGRYTTVENDNGKTVRLSKKVFPVFDCAENSTAINRTRCQERISSMQEKMAASITAPTTDFAGLIDMIKTLEEN